MSTSVFYRLTASISLLFLINAVVVAGPEILIPSAIGGGTVWLYTTGEPNGNWTAPGFTDSEWSQGKSGFGVKDRVTPPETIGTAWNSSGIWLRKTIKPPHPLKFHRAGLIVRHDEDVEVYINGALVFAASGYNTEWLAYDVTERVKKSLKPGENVVAVHVTQSGGGQYIDVGLVLDPEKKLRTPAFPMALAELQKLRESRWPAEKAWKWYSEVSPITGCNYVPRTAVNTTEMWQEETFDPRTIDQELGWAERYGLNSVRVFIQYIVYEDDPKGLINRLDTFLAIAWKHNISVMFVLFDDCFKPEPKLGKQPDPVPGVHNSQWTSSPGNRRKQPDYWPKLEKYVKHVVGHFSQDKRVLVWDLFNEAKKASRPLVLRAFKWARKANPSQPLTSCWQAADVSDVITLHDYKKPDPKELARLRARRPAISTECIARGRGSTFQAVIPAYAEAGIGWYMWGLVQGRIQTYYPWGSPKGAPEPAPWHHDLLRPDGTPYRAEEIDLIRTFKKNFKMPELNRR